MSNIVAGKCYVLCIMNHEIYIICKFHILQLFIILKIMRVMLYIRCCWCVRQCCKNFMLHTFYVSCKSSWITGKVIGPVEIGILQAQLFVLQYWRSWLYFEITFEASKPNYIFPRWNRTVSMDTSYIIRKIGTTNFFSISHNFTGAWRILKV